MARKDEKSAGGDANGDDASGTSKRPSRVIDLEAAEVETGEKSDAAGEQGGDDKAHKADPDVKAGDNAAKVPPAAPRRRTKPTDIRGFVTHLAAGLAGGLIGVIGAGVTLDRLPLDAQNGGRQEVSQEIQKIGQRLDALDATVDKQTKSAAGAGPEAAADAIRALNRIEARLGVIEGKPAAAAPDLEPLTTRLANLEAAFEALRASGTQGGEPAAAPPDALNEKIGDISRKLERRTASLGADIEALKSALKARPSLQGEGTVSQSGAVEARLAALENRPGAAGQDLQPLTDRLTKLEAALQAPAAGEGASGEAQSSALTEKIADISRKLERRTASIGQKIEAIQSKVTTLAARPVAPVAQISAKSDGAALSLAFDILRRTVDRGAPFADQLKALKEAAPDGLDLSALSAHAEAGMRTGNALLTDLGSALRDAREAAARSDDDTFLDRLAANARSVVRVRRMGQTEGTGAAAILSRMEAHMKAADLHGVLKQAEDLSGPARQSLQPWLELALAKRAVDTTLAEFERALLAGLQSGSGAGKSN